LILGQNSTWLVWVIDIHLHWKWILQGFAGISSDAIKMRFVRKEMREASLTDLAVFAQGWCSFCFKN
jgi:hypothetical protein